MSDEPKKTLKLTPKPEIPGAKQTIRLRPSATPPPAPGVAPEVKRTIKLTPPPAAGATAPGVPTTSGRVPPVMGSVPTSTGRVPVAGHVPTSTGKVPVMRPAPTPTVAGAVPTASGKIPPITPSTASGRISHVAVPPSQLLDTATASVPKVVPISENVASGIAAQDLGGEKPAPGKTLQLKRPSASGASNPTVKLSGNSAAPGASSPTLQLNNNSDAPSAGGRTLKLKKEGTMAGLHQEMKDEGVGEESNFDTTFRPGAYKAEVEVDEGTGAMPYAIIATVALLCVAFLTYASIALFTNLFSEDAVSKNESSQYLSVPSFLDFKDVKDGKR